MVRLACVSIPRVDLQVLALRHPDWRYLPASVVTEEKPLGRLTMVNRAAQNAGVQPGMRYASALSICPQLRAGVVQPEEREELKTELAEVLRGFTPDVEPSAEDAALFWVNASGLGRLYPTLATWAGALENAIQRRDLVCSVAVGFSRFGTYAAARSRRALTIFETEDQERAAALRSPVGVLPLDHEVLLRFHQLGILTIRDFNRFSSGALRRRFGKAVEKLQLFARGEESVPIQPVAQTQEMVREMRLLYPERSSDALRRHLHQLFRELIIQVRSRQDLISEIVITLCPERWPGSMDECIEELLRAARPGNDQNLWERLLALRFERLELPGPVVRLGVQAVTTNSTREQGDLFSGPSKRDPNKAMAAIAEICAELGNDAVQIAELRNSHLPSEQYTWRRVERLSVPMPTAPVAGIGVVPAVSEAAPDAGPAAASWPPVVAPEAATAAARSAGLAGTRSPLIRRILDAATRLSGMPDAPGGRGFRGPYVLSGGWWNDHAGHDNRSCAYERDYYYLEGSDGRLLWIYYDVPNRQWMLQGVVE